MPLRLALALILAPLKPFAFGAMAVDVGERGHGKGAGYVAHEAECGAQHDMSSSHQITDSWLFLGALGVAGANRIFYEPQGNIRSMWWDLL